LRDGHAGRAVRDPEWDAQRPSGEPPALRAARCRLNVMLLVLITALLLAASAVNG